MSYWALLGKGTPLGPRQKSYCRYYRKPGQTGRNHVDPKLAYARVQALS
jgi:hypothetical protein